MHIQVLPYSPPNLSSTFLRVIVKPIPKEETTTDSGLLIPSDIGRICEIGEVIAVCDGSSIKPGDKIRYRKIDRTSNEHLDTISIEGQKCDVLYENEVWAVNDHPFNLIFAAPISNMEVDGEGLFIPGNVLGITQKGKVFRAPEDFHIKTGDDIEYRKQERGIYPTIEIDGKRYEVLREADVFLVNGSVAPYRIIVKIDIGAQRIKRNTTGSGLIRSPLFQHMLFNMQVGEVMEIGEEAQKNYPELKVGDQAILHHRVESEGYRLIGRDFSKHDKNLVTYEYRVLDGFMESRDVFGRIVNRKKGIFAPFGKAVFLDWEFEVAEKSPASGGSLLLDFETNLDRCVTLDDFKSVLGHKKKEGIGKAQAKIHGTLDILSHINPESDKDRFDEQESMLNLAKREAEKIAAYLNKNHLLHCTVLGGSERVLVPYKELYPINILGFKFLIGYRDFVVAKTSFAADAVHSD